MTLELVICGRSVAIGLCALAPQSLSLRKESESSRRDGEEQQKRETAACKDSKGRPISQVYRSRRALVGIKIAVGTLLTPLQPRWQRVNESA